MRFAETLGHDLVRDHRFDNVDFVVLRCVEAAGRMRSTLLLAEEDLPGLVHFRGFRHIRDKTFAVLEDNQPVDLASLCRNRRRQVFDDLIEALSALHERGKAYGWLSPATVVACAGCFKLHRFAMGTDVAYVAPEVERGAPISTASDIFSLATMMRIFLPEICLPPSVLNSDPNRRPGIRSLREAMLTFNTKGLLLPFHSA